MNEDEQVIWGQPVSFQDFVQGFQPAQRRVELVPKADPQKFYVREKVTPSSQNQGEIRDANKERVNRSLSNYASNNFLLSTSNIRPDQNGKYNPGLGQFAGDQTALTLSMGFDPFNTSNYYKVATQIPKFRNWGLTRLLANELNNEVRVAGELGKNVGKSTVNPIIRTKIGDVEINNPELYYHQSGLGKAKNFFNTNRMRTPQEEYWLKQEHVPLELRTGIIPGFPQNPGRAMFSQGKLWYGLNPEQFPDLLVTAKEMPVANSKAGIVRGSLQKLESQGTRRVTSDNIGDIGPHTNQNTSAYTYIPRYGYRQIQQEPKTSLRFFERPQSKISEAERAGIPKGERAINDPKVLENAKQFAEKYGYKVPTTVEEAKNMYKTHNRFFRSINMEPFEKAYPEFGIFPEKEFPELVGLTREEKLKTLASKGYPRFWRTHDLNDIGSGFSDDFVFVSPSLAENAAYANSMGTNFSNTVMLQRPFSFGKPTEWHINADWRPSQEVFGRIHRKGEVSIGNSPLKNEAKVSTKHLIPVKIAQPGDQGTTLGDFLYKQKYNLK